MKFRTFILIPSVVFFLSLLSPGHTYYAGEFKAQNVSLEVPAVNEGSTVETSISEADIVPEAEDAATPPDTLVVPDTEEQEPLRIAAVGDIMLGRGVGARLEAKKLGYTYPFTTVADILSKGDVVFGNLEQPITQSEKCFDKRYKFVLKSKVEALEGIKYAGFNLLSLANNHILDYYDKGLTDTIQILNSNGIAFSGAGKNLEEAREPAVIEKKGIKIGLLSYTDMAEIIYKGNPSISFIADGNKAGVAPRKLEYILEDIEKARKDVDLLIISLHWGVEESFNVLPDQMEFAHRLIDNGADIILGHHPHQFQGIEIYKGKPVAYSLGNFIFDQNDPENQESFILNLEFTGNKLSALSALPVKTIDKIQVVRQTGLGARGILNREMELSAALNTKCSIVDDKLVFEVN